MKQSQLIYKIFLPITLLLLVLATIFNSLSLSLTYDSFTSNIGIGSPLSILFIVFVSLCFAAPIVLGFLTKETSIITRTVKNTIFEKVAASIVILSLLALLGYDVVILFQEIAYAADIQGYTMSFSEALKQHFELWRLFRAILTIPFIVHLVFGFLPKSSVSTLVKAFFHCTAILWCMMTPIIIYFYSGTPPIPEYFRITFSIMFILFTLFLLFDFKWIYFDSSIRIYSALTLMTFIFASVISVGTVVGLIANSELSINELSLSLFEVIVSISLAIYSLSKWLEIYKTVNIVAENEEGK